MQKASKRLLSMLLALVLVFSMVTAAFATEIDGETPTEQPESETVEVVLDTVTAEAAEEIEPTLESPEPVKEPAAPGPEKIAVTEQPTETAPPAVETTEPPAETEPPVEEATEPPTESEPPAETIVEATEATEPTDPADDGGLGFDLFGNGDSDLDPSLAEYGFSSNIIMRQTVGLDEPEESPLMASKSYAKTATLIDCDQMDMMTNDGNRLGFHIADEDGRMPWDYMNLIYCLESNKGFSYGGGHEGSGGVSLDGYAERYGERVWYNLSYDQRVAIGLVLLYGAPTKLWDYGWGINANGNHDMHNPNIGYRFATQALIWEIADGKRQATYPYTLYDAHWYDLAVGQCTGADGTDHFAYAYNSIVSDMQNHSVIPSFTSASESSAPELGLTGNAASFTDTNSVLSRFSFTDKDGASFSKSGNVLNISVSTPVTGTIHTATASVPSPYASIYEVWYNQFNSSKQTCIKVTTPATGAVSAYFKLKASSGNLSLQKTTEDGLNLRDWQFSLYADAACTRLVSGPYTTDSTGKLLVKDLAAGEVWVKEIGHQDAAINALYHCEGENPQKVTITSGETASVAFHNKLNYGYCKILKTLANPEAGTVEGWTFDLHKVAEGGELQYLATLTTGKDGTIQQELRPGTYQVTEKLADTALWQCTTELIQTVTVEAGRAATVSFTNALRPGEIKVHKVNTSGENLGGVVFLLEWSTDGKSWAPVSFTDSSVPQVGGCTSQGLSDGKLSSNEAGQLSFTGLHPMLYYRLSEVSTLPGYELLTGYAYHGQLPVDEGLTVPLRVVNAPGFTLPKTGGNGFVYLAYLSTILCGGLLLAAWLTYKRKEINKSQSL